MLLIPAMPKSATAQMDYIVEAMEMPALNAIIFLSGAITSGR